MTTTNNILKYSISSGCQETCLGAGLIWKRCHFITSLESSRLVPKPCGVLPNTAWRCRRGNQLWNQRVNPSGLPCFRQSERRHRLGEDLLATVNAFCRHNTDIDEVGTPTSLYPGLATMGLVKKVGRIFYEAIGKQPPQTVDPEESGTLRIRMKWIVIRKKRNASRL